MLQSLLVLLSLAHLSLSQCYMANGTLIPDRPDIVQCNGNIGATSLCCASNRTVASGDNTDNTMAQWTRDICLPNGLCQNVVKDYSDGGADEYEYWRYGCSNPDWIGCGVIQSVCPGPDAAELTPCGDTWNTTRYCCGHNASSCCAAWDSRPSGSFEIPLDAYAVVASPSGSPSSSASTYAVVASATGSPSSSASALASASASPPHTGLTTGAKAGIGAGVAIGVLTVLGSVFIYMRWWRRKLYSTMQQGSGELKVELPAAEEQKFEPVEGNSGISTPDDAHELASKPAAYELDGRDRNV